MKDNQQRRPATFSESVDSFLATADWLDDSHAPSVMALIALASEMDREITPALAAQFGLYHRSLMKAKPDTALPVNPFEELLRR